MKTYKLTAFEANGEKIVDEAFQAEHDDAAKEIAEKLLTEKNLLEKTHRCTSPSGKLLLFHSNNNKKEAELLLFLSFYLPINLGCLFSINALIPS